MSAPTLVLVHGIHDTGAIFDRQCARYEADGRQVLAPDLVPADGAPGIAHLAGRLVVALEPLGGGAIDLVGFSLGGLVARYYVQRLGGDRVRRLVTIGSPHGGTLNARFIAGRLGDDLQPSSALLQDLAQDWPGWAARVPTTTIWTPYDLIVLPARHARLPGATSVRVPAARHRRLLEDARTWRAVDEALR